MRPDSRLTLLLSVCALAACTRPAVDPGEPIPLEPAPPTVAASTRNALRFKGPERLTADFAAALSLPEDQVCNELGQYSCTGFVHTVTLGGVAPYEVGLYEPLPATGVTTPIAVDRVALAACSRRVALDLSKPASAVLFGAIVLDDKGRLVEREGAAVHNALVALYQRGLQRDPSLEEVAALVKLSTDIEATGSARPGRDWMTAACFVVLSSAESVFF